MAGFGQYLKDTRSELRHVAWPTRTQTIVYTVLVALISIAVSLYLGFFDFLFTAGLARTLESLPGTSPVTITDIGTSSASNIAASTTPGASSPIPDIPGESN